MATLPVYSANKLKSWSRCQRQYELDHVRRLSWPRNTGHFELGLTVHRLMEEAAKGHDLSTLLAALPDKTRVFTEALLDNRWAKLPVVASEWGFNVNVSGHWLTGRLDRISRDGDNLIIIDWKTGTSAPLDAANDWQTRLYLYALHQTAASQLGHPVTADTLAFVYLQVAEAENGPEIKEVIVTYDEAMHAETLRMLQQTLTHISTAEHYVLPPACPDAYCVYTHVCGILAKTVC